MHVVIITTNEYDETGSCSLTVDEFMSEALDMEPDDTIEQWELLEDLVAGRSRKQIDSDMIRERRAGPGLNTAIEAWLGLKPNADALNEARQAAEQM